MSVGFPYTQTATLQNNSRIPFEFYFKHKLACLEITPSRGWLYPSDQTKINVICTPTEEAVYDKHAELWMEGIDQPLCKLSLQGRSDRAQLALRESQLDLGRCFLQYAYTASVSLVNTSDLPAGYQIEDINGSEACAKITSSPSQGVLPAKVCFCCDLLGHCVLQSTVALKLEFVPQMLGLHAISVPIKTTSVLKTALEATFECVGPCLRLESKDPRFTLKERSSISFGKIPVLQDQPIQLHLTNPSPIPAQIRCRLQNANSGFKVTNSVDGQQHSVHITDFSRCFAVAPWIVN